MNTWLKKLKHLFKNITKNPRFIDMLGSLMYYYSRWIGSTTKWDIFGLNQFYQTWHQEK